MPRRPRPLVLPLVLLAALALSGTTTAPRAAAVTVPSPGTYVPITPVRALDTRSAVGIATRTPVPGGGIVPVDTTVVPGLPASGVGAVVVTLTVTAPQAGGYLTAWADGEDMPPTSSLNWAPQQTVANTAVVPVGQDGRLLLESGSVAPAHLVLDVEGYVAAGKPATAGAYTPMSPQRVLDTRKAVGVTTTTPLPPTSSTRLTLAGRGGPAAGAGAVVLNLTATAGTQTGYVALGGKPANGSGGSVLTWRPGQTIASLVVAPLDPDGTVTLYVASVGTVHLVADLVGVLTPGDGTDPGTTTVKLPYRQLDTRAPGATFGALAARTSRVVAIASGPLASTPGPLSAVLVTVTVTNTRAGGYLTGYASGGSVPTASLVNWATGQTVSATVLLPVGPDGRIALYNGSVGAADVVVDLSGRVAGAAG